MRYNHTLKDGHNAQSNCSCSLSVVMVGYISTPQLSFFKILSSSSSSSSAAAAAAFLGRRFIPAISSVSIQAAYLSPRGMSHSLLINSCPSAAAQLYPQALLHPYFFSEPLPAHHSELPIPPPRHAEVNVFEDIILILNGNASYTSSGCLLSVFPLSPHSSFSSSTTTAHLHDDYRPLVSQILMPRWELWTLVSCPYRWLSESHTL